MGSAVLKLLKIGNELPAYLPEEYGEQMKQKLINLNIKRERILAFILSVFLVIIVGSILLIDNNTILDKYVAKESIHIHFVLITLAVIFLLGTNKINAISKVNVRILHTYHYIIVSTVMLASSIIALNNEMLNQRPFTYTIVMYTIASVVMLNFRERLAIYFLPYLIYIGGCILNWGISIRLIEIIVSTLPLLILAMVVSRINYSAFVNSFINNKLIHEKNMQLDNMYKTVEEALLKRTEQLNQVMELDKIKTDFFSNISHELRTPLNIIFSAEQMLDRVCKEKNIQSKRQEIIKYNNMIQQNCYRLIRLIENLIDITEIDTGQISIKLGKHDIVKLVQEVTSATAEFINGRKLRLVFQSDLKHRIIVCDAEKVERIVLNLLSNAVKFTPEGGEIIVNLYERSGKIIIKVCDTGIGIPGDMKELVFDRFVQVDKSISRQREGSGIGLSIVKAFVELHNGAIDINSDVGRGSDFVIELPTDLTASTEESINIPIHNKCYEKIKMEFSDLYN